MNAKELYKLASTAQKLIVVITVNYTLERKHFNIVEDSLGVRGRPRSETARN